MGSSVSIPGAPFETRSNDCRQLCFSTPTRSGTWSVATIERSPSARPGPQDGRVVGWPERRRDHVAGGRLRVARVAILGEGEIDRAGLGEHRESLGAGGPHLGQGVRRREVHDVQRRPGGTGEGDRPPRRLGLDVRRSRRRVVAGPDLAGGEVPGCQGFEDRPVLAVDLQHPALPAGCLEGPEDGDVVEAEVVDHEGLERRDAGVDGGGDLGDRVLVGRRDDQAGCHVHGGVARGRRAPLAEAGHQRAGGGRRRPGAGVVEGEKRRGAAERSADRVVEEAVRPLVGRDAGVGVDVDDPGEHEEAARVDDLPGRRGEPAEVGLHGRRSARRRRRCPPAWSLPS